MRSTKTRLLLMVLVAALCVGSVSSGMTEPLQAGATKTMTLNQAKVLALSKSKTYKKLKIKLATTKSKYLSAVKSVNMKYKHLTSFSWSPLFSFHFPETPDLAEAYEFNFKALEIQSQINTYQHTLNDTVYGVYEDATNLYVKIYTAQENIAFNEKRLASMQTTLERNKIRLQEGKANKADVDSMEKAISSLEKTIAADKKTFTNNKEKLYKMTGLDCRTGYNFKNPYKKADIPRSKIAWITDYTLERSDAYYSASISESLMKTSLNTYWNLMNGQYGGGVMGPLRKYYNAALLGQDIDEEALKADYDRATENANRPWTGSFRIIFFKIQRKWLQGDTDGSNYIEDEPYALYNAILDYQDKLAEKNSCKSDIETQVKDDYENLINLKVAYENLKEQSAEDAESLEAALINNALGTVTYEEYSGMQKDFEELQLSVTAALDSYTQALVTYDRFTCGAITELLKDDGADSADTIGGSSYLIEDQVEGVAYYINTLVDKKVFELGIYVPDDFAIEMTDFELWVNNVRVGKRTKIDKVLRHLLLTTQNTDDVFLRFYNDKEFVDDVPIDPKVYYKEIQITSGYHTVPMDEEGCLGSYSIEVDEKLGFHNFTFKSNASNPDIAFYKLRGANGNYLYSEDYVKVGESMPYLGILKDSMKDITIALYDETYNRLFYGEFDTEKLKVYAK